MLTRKEYKSDSGKKKMKTTNTFMISLMLFAITSPMVTVTRADTIQRFIYKNISDTATLPRGKQEFSYHFWLEDWDMQGWDITVIRNELTYRFGLSHYTEVGINQMHSILRYYYKGYYWGNRSGFNDLQLYGKHQFLREPDGPVTVSIGGKLYAPTGSAGGFSADELRIGEFVAVSKVIGSWRFAGHFGQICYDESYWKDYNYWGVGAMEKESGLNLEIFGSENYLQGLIGRTQWMDQGYVQYGLAIPMDGSDMDWRFIFGLGFQF